MNLNFQPFILFGQFKVSAKSRDNAEIALFSAIKSKNLNVQVDDQGLFQFSNQYFLSTILRYDYFQGVKSGEIRLFVEPEGKIDIRYKLFVAPIGWIMAITILFLILTLPLPPSSVSGSLIGDGISIVIGGLIFFMFWREYIRLNVKLFIRRTINH
jgi:hypothetical protein